MPTLRRAAIAACALALVVLVAPAAQAKERFGKCPNTPFYRCAKVKVPLDHSGEVRGGVRLHVQRLPRGRRRKTDTALVALAGGPGQSAVAAFGSEDLPDALGPALRTRRLVIYDQRGTGLSGPLRCPRFERVIRRTDLEREALEAQACARKIGRRRAFYTTRDSVEDLEAVRKAVGARKLALYGVSYGSKLALAYAQRYPKRVERLLLDSIQEPEGPDPLYRDTFAAMPRALEGVCAGGACASFTSDPAADLNALVRQLSSSGVSGPIYDARGRPRQRALERFELFALMLAGDFDQSLRAAMLPAVQSALRGDYAPILRLAHPEVTSDMRAEAARRVRQPLPFSEALFAATICEEAAMPWERSAPFEERPGQAAAAVEALPESAFYPFDRTSVLETEFLRICSLWPSAPEPPLLSGEPMPDVPVLLLNGTDDLRTPLEEARRVAERLPDATLIEVGASGHSVLSDPPACAERAVKRFFAGRRVSAAPCARRRNDVPPPLAPLSVDDVEPAQGAPADRVGRTVSAVAMTVRDVDQQAAFFERGGGLRGGRFRAGFRLVLREVMFVPGLEVTGEFDLSFRGKLHGEVRVSGPGGANGTLRINTRGRVRGELDGRRVDARVTLSDPFPGEEPPPAQRRRPDLGG